MTKASTTKTVKVPPAPISTVKMEETEKTVHRLFRARFLAQRRACRVILLGGAVAKAVGTDDSDVVTEEELRALIQAVRDYPWDQQARDDLRNALEALAQHAGTTAANQIMQLTGDADAVATLTQANTDAVAWASDRVGNDITGIDDTSQDVINQLTANAIQSGMTNADLADRLDGAFLFGEDRAAMIARTETQTAANAGAVAGYKAAGVTMKEWYGEDPCDDCADNVDAGPIGIDEDFPTGDDAPPAHPNAVLSGSSFASYGRLLQMLGSRYDGPAITLEAEFVDEFQESAAGNAELRTDGLEREIGGEQHGDQRETFGTHFRGATSTVSPNGVRLTIGPNHPMLARRGWVRASEIREGDQLLYDTRGVLTEARGEPHLEQVTLVEDAFHAIRTAFGYTDVARSRRYFHGDEVACYGEVQVVRPTRNLSTVLDAGGVEHLSECPLARAYPDATHVAGCGTCHALFDRTFASAHGGMSGSGERLALSQRATLPVSSETIGGGLRAGGTRVGIHAVPSPFRSVRVLACHVSQFSGWAYDASTADTIYNSGGFVVKNCRCSVGAVVELATDAA
jgi:hypothetical protein